MQVLVEGNWTSDVELQLRRFEKSLIIALKGHSLLSRKSSMNLWHNFFEVGQKSGSYGTLREFYAGHGLLLLSKATHPIYLFIFKTVNVPPKEKGWDGKESEDTQTWTFTGALFYSITVITTIGERGDGANCDLPLS